MILSFNCLMLLRSFNYAELFKTADAGRYEEGRRRRSVEIELNWTLCSFLEYDFVKSLDLAFRDGLSFMTTALVW